VYFTSVEVTGWPSCQVALSTIVKVIVRPSSEVSHEVASSGNTLYDQSSETSML
jgi:hypothetical protein